MNVNVLWITLMFWVVFLALIIQKKRSEGWCSGRRSLAQDIHYCIFWLDEFKHSFLSNQVWIWKTDDKKITMKLIQFYQSSLYENMNESESRIRKSISVQQWNFSHDSQVYEGFYSISLASILTQPSGYVLLSAPVMSKGFPADLAFIAPYRIKLGRARFPLFPQKTAHTGL